MADSLAPLVTAKIKSINSLLSRLEAVAERYEYIWQNRAPEITGPLASAISKIHTSARQMPTAKNFTLGAMVGACDLEFALARNALAGFDPTNIKAEVSPTYLMVTAQEIQSFVDYYFMYANEPTTESIYGLIISALASEPMANVEAAYLAAGSVSAKLYANYLQRTLDAGGKRIDEAIAMLERAKSASLLYPGYTQPPPPSKDMWPMQRFGLMPERQHMTIGELIDFFFSAKRRTKGTRGGSAKSTFADLVASAQSHKTNVLALIYSTGNPVEYALAKLIDPVEAKEFIEKATAGLSAKMIDRFAIVKQYGADDSRSATASANFEIKRIEHSASHRWIIVRSLDGGKYWDVMGGGPDPRAIADKLARGPSPRIDAYNELKNRMFVGAFRKAPEVIDEIKADNKPLVNLLVSRIITRIVRYVDEKLVPLPTKPAEIESAISDPAFVNILADELLKSYSECGISADAPADEYLGSFVADVEGSILVQFARNLRLNMMEMGPDAKLFRDYSGETLKTRLYNIFVDIIKRSVTTTLLTKENIYDKILIKDALMATLAQ